MSTTYHDQKNPPEYRITHFTPQSRAHWCWIVTIPCITLSGVQDTITGQRVNVGPGMTMRSGLAGAPSFQTRDAAIHWAELMQLPNLSIED